MRLLDYQKLLSVGVPADILGRVAVAVPVPSEIPPPPESLFPAAPLPTSAVPSPSVEPARDALISHLAPAFSLRLWLALREANRQGLHIACFEGLRTPARQAWLYAQGRTRPGSIVTNAATVFSSWHGYGLAADCVFINSAGQWNWPDITSSLWREWYRIANLFGLTTGVNWAVPVDAPHTYPSYLTKSPSLTDRSILQSAGLRGIWKAKDQLTLASSLFQQVA